MSAATVTIRMPNAPRPCKVRPLGNKRNAARVERQLRQALAPWGLPLDLYDCAVEVSSVGEGPYNDSGTIFYHDNIPVSATFTHRETGAEITITEIWLGDRGEILQYGTQYGALTL